MTKTVAYIIEIILIIMTITTIMIVTNDDKPLRTYLFVMYYFIFM